jgi:hypothetical protein
MRFFLLSLVLVSQDFDLDFGTNLLCGNWNIFSGVDIGILGPEVFKLIAAGRWSSWPLQELKNRYKL